MPIAVVGKNYTLISTCDLITSQGAWTGVDTADTVDKKQGASSLCGTLKAAGANNTTFIPTGSPTTKLDLSGEKHLRFWFLITSGALVELYANGGIQFWATDGTNIGYWYVGGRDTYSGGWQNFVVDLTKGVDSGTKPTDMSQITQIGTRHVLTAAGKNVDNVWIDHFCVCDGLVVSGDIDTGVITCNANSAGTYTRTAGGSGSFETDGFRVGMDFTASGFTGSNNGTRTISIVTATVITVTDNTNMTTETGTADERVRGYVGLQEVFAITNTPSTSHGIGVLTRKAGIYCLTGVLEIGLATSLTRFQVKSQALVFEDRIGKGGIYSNVKSTLMKILVTDSGNASYTTEFILGAKSGVQGISGCTVRSQSVTQLAKFSIDASGVNVDNFKLYGSSFLGATTISLPANATNNEVLNCNFESCGKVLADTCVVKYCNFISCLSTVNAAVLINDDPHYVTDCNFISNPKAVEMDTLGDGGYDFNNLKFSGNTFDVNNTCGSTLTITKIGTSDPSTYTGTSVSFQSSLTITITIQDKLTNPIPTAQTAVYKISDRTEIMNEDTRDVDITALIEGTKYIITSVGTGNWTSIGAIYGTLDEVFTKNSTAGTGTGTASDGVATESYVGGTPVAVEIRCRKASSGATRYKNFSTLATLSGNFDLLITLIEDLYNNTTE